MTCDEVALRLYDEDCRTSLLHGEEAPADVAAHLAACAHCREEWPLAVNDAGALRKAFDEPVPGELRAALYRIPLRTRTRTWPRHLRHAADALSASALVTLVTAFAFSPAPRWQIATFLGALLTLTVYERARSLGLDLPRRTVLRIPASGGRDAPPGTGARRRPRG